MRASRARLAALVFATSTTLLGPRDAFAYCRTASCPDGITGARCVPAQPDDCGVPLAWSSPCIGFDMQQDASRRVPLETATAIFHAAFATWSRAACAAGGTPRVDVRDLGPVACATHEYNQRAGNANVILFRDDAWPHQGQGSTLALTTVTFNLDTGEIYDADMELNSANIAFSTSDVGVTYDLLSVATHETGHFLGLSHSPMPDATMYFDYKPGSTSLRTLGADDDTALCAVYPPGEAIPATCDPTPRHGFSSVCAKDASATAGGSTGCCGSTTSPSSGTSSAGAFAAGLGAIASRMRRRKRT